MRYGSLFLSLLLLPLAAASTDARAQGAVFEWEVGIDVDSRTTLNVYTSDGDLEATFTIDATPASPDWTGDFNGNDATWEADWDDLGTAFLTFEFIGGGGLSSQATGRYVYVPGYVAYDLNERDFYYPAYPTGSPDIRFDVNGGDVRARVGPGDSDPFYEDTFAGSYVIPYNFGYFCAPSCPSLPPGYFLTPVDYVPDAAAEPPRFTFAAEADAVVASTWASVAEDLELAFPAGRRLLVEGRLNATDVTFTEAVTGQGWGGLVFQQGTESALPNSLDGCVVEHVKGPVGVPGDAAVEVYDDLVTLSGTFIQDGENVNGVWASGTGALVTLDQSSFVQRMEVDGTGVVAADGAEVRVYNSTIQENGYVGAGATGTGSLLYLAESGVSGNSAFGVVSEAGGEVAFRRHDDPNPDDGVLVDDNDSGGLYAFATSDVVAGVWHSTFGYCIAACYNSITNNWQGSGNFDAKSVKSSVLYARSNYWGTDGAGQLRDENDLEVVTATGGVVYVPPIWDGTAPRVGAPARRGGEAPRLLLGPVASLVDEAYRAVAHGDSAAASAALLAALPLAVEPEELGLAFGTTGRHLSHAPAPALEAYLPTRTRPGDAARPWALTALLAAYAEQGRTSEARATAGTLAEEYAGTDHALAGLTVAARLAAAEGDLAAAEVALAALRAGWPDLLATEAAEALVARLRGGSAPEGRTLAEASATAPATGEAAFRLLSARPNPFGGSSQSLLAVVPFEVGAPAHVRLAVYDVLGREVAVLADGAFAPGRHEAAFDGRALAAGLYLVRARVESGAGAARSYAAPVTLVR